MTDIIVLKNRLAQLKAKKNSLLTQKKSERTDNISDVEGQINRVQRWLKELA